MLIKENALEKRTDEGWIPEDLFKFRDLIPFGGMIPSAWRMVKETIHTCSSTAEASYKPFVRTTFRAGETLAMLGCNYAYMVIIGEVYNLVQNTSM